MAYRAGYAGGQPRYPRSISAAGARGGQPREATRGLPMRIKIRRFWRLGRVRKFVILNGVKNPCSALANVAAEKERILPFVRMTIPACTLSIRGSTALT